MMRPTQPLLFTALFALSLVNGFLINDFSHARRTRQSFHVPDDDLQRNWPFLFGLEMTSLDDANSDDAVFDWSSIESSSSSSSSSSNDPIVEMQDGIEPENVHIPSTGISVSDELEAAQRDAFVTTLVPIRGLKGVAQLVTSGVLRGSFEPVRYLVSLSPPTVVAPTKDASDSSAEQVENKSDELEDEENAETTTQFTGTTFVMIDVPPFSSQLEKRLKAYMGQNYNLAAILITSRDAIHYEEAPGVFVASRRDADLKQWLRAFPQLEVVAYRLDIPRDCRPSVTQVLDGQGPFAWDETPTESIDGSNSHPMGSFVETGRPLTYEVWDDDTAAKVLSGETPPDDADEEEQDVAEDDDNKEDLYSPEAIRKKELGKQVLALYTPGHSFGSLSFVFPERQLCCSGFTLPVEDAREEDNEGFEGAGPSLDVRGYITTSRAGMTRQMESARQLVTTYSDRFHVILPSRGDPLFLDPSQPQQRQEMLLEMIDEYDRIGQIYEQLGITTGSSDDMDSLFKP